ncbi:MAG: hypothetical protein ACYC3L_13490 [Gemmatimonadaceae bacterium]
MPSLPPPRRCRVHPVVVPELELSDVERQVLRRHLRDKISLNLIWLRDESLEDSASLPEPHLLAQEIADDLRSALAQIEDVLGDLEQRVVSEDVG